MLTQNIDSIITDLREIKEDIKKNPLKYDIHPLDFIKIKKEIKKIETQIEDTLLQKE